MLLSFTELVGKVDTLKKYLPTYEDLQGSVNALLRLQDVYKLDTSDIAAGSVGGVTSSELTGKGLYSVLNILNMLDFSIFWTFSWHFCDDRAWHNMWIIS